MNQEQHICGGPAKDDRQMARRIAERVAGAGGRVYYVGGYVRDQLMHRDNKDIDIEVHGITPQQLCDILDSLGERTVMGASFGIYGLRHYDLDIAMPRRERATGRGHRDFEVDVDPFQGTEKAAIRRDFTINALMQDVLTGEVIDHFGGIQDLRKGIIRHVSADTYAEDPLRVLRAAQFAARFGFTVAEETVALSRGMELSALAAERVMGEVEKALRKAEHPSVFFRLMRDMAQLGCWFPELQGMSDDAWAHMTRLMDEAAALRTRATEPLAFMLAALCCILPAEDALRLLTRLTNDRMLHKYVENMVALFGQPTLQLLQSCDAFAFCRLFDRSVCPEDLLLLEQAAYCAAPPSGLTLDSLTARLQAHLAHYRQIMALPFVRGADLTAAGFRPGADFGEVLAYAHEQRLRGVDKEAVLNRTIALLRERRGEESGWS